VDGATHWIVHEQPALVAAYLQEFLRQAPFSPRQFAT
jgi:pimeloyl-ACP methyl ester carboxylesterase